MHQAHRVDDRDVVCVRVCGLRAFIQGAAERGRPRERERERERGRRERVDVVGLRLTRAMPHSDTSAVAATPAQPGYHIANNDVDTNL